MKDTKDTKETSDILIPVSVGEILDKLSILHIKKQYITDVNKLKDIELEYSSVYKVVEHLFKNPALNYHYNCLIKINTIIWNLCDDIRKEEHIEKKSDGYSNLCIEIIQVNDQRFRIKNKINLMSNSKLREKKSYPNKKAVILTHLGMGDMMTMNGAIRYLATLYDELIVISDAKYVKAVERMYSDDSSIKIKGIPNIHNDKIELDKYKDQDYTLIKTGSSPGNEQFYIEFYENLKLDYNKIRFPWCYINRNIENENLLIKHIVSKLTDPVSIVFVHETNYKYVLSPELYNPDMLIYNPNRNMYNPDHKYYHVWDGILSDNIFDYSTLIEMSSVIVVAESSFFCLATHLNLATKYKFVINQRMKYDLINYFPPGKSSDWIIKDFKE